MAIHFKKHAINSTDDHTGQGDIVTHNESEFAKLAANNIFTGNKQTIQANESTGKFLILKDTTSGEFWYFIHNTHEGENSLMLRFWDGIDSTYNVMTCDIKGNVTFLKPIVGMPINITMQQNSQCDDTVGNSLFDVNVVKAGQYMSFEAEILMSSDNAANGIRLAVQGFPGGAGAWGQIEIRSWTAATTEAITHLTTGDFTGDTSSAGTDKRFYKVKGVLYAGDTDFEFWIKFKNEVAGHTCTAYAGSWMNYRIVDEV